MFMLRKRILALLSVLAVIASILVFTLTSKAEESLIPEDYSKETEETEDTEEIKFPVAGVSAALKDGSDYESVKIAADEKLAPASVKLEDITVKVSDNLEELEASLEESSGDATEEAEADEAEEEIPASEETEEVNYDAICLVGDYIHLRKEASEISETTGVFYHNAVAEIIGEENEWYQIKSGNVTGYVRKSMVAIGEEAQEKIEESKVTTATVEKENLIVRMAPNKNATGIEIVPENEELQVVGMMDDWIAIATEDGTGYIYKPYTKVQTQYITALTADEITAQDKEALRNAMEERAQQCIAYNASNGQPSSFTTREESNEKGQEVAEFALQFVGNPYVWGGVSLTDGCDCSGFVMSIYKEFGFELTHSTEIDQTEGEAVETIEGAEAGDIICYQGHVAIYIGDGMIVHAAGEAKGIIISPACYDNIITVRRMFTE